MKTKEKSKKSSTNLRKLGRYNNQIQTRIKSVIRNMKPMKKLVKYKQYGISVTKMK